ncbi:hypothetical protein DNI29_19110 [Hymenobacter sediminis]|uniref:hypothetical protein n=1 Tax=Hymenobacter sediminis TaxID=2218621 RepID=UPI000DA66C70|nr:hypothetical protein [Hymenobacter sediminis]RPD45492.1 hypothetical protein DNI29_19110 [Hymenobacter sediminis]
MAIEITSKVKGTDSDGSEYPACCGQSPIKTTWAKGMGKDAVLLTCRNPSCRNAAGVFACDVDIARKWDKYRKLASSALPLTSGLYDA